MKNVAGRVAVVTGAASGIGRGMANVFADAGMKVVLSDIEEAPLVEATGALRKRGHAVHAVVTDVAKPEAVEALAVEAAATFGNVHLVCNNAGVAAPPGLLWETAPEDWTWIEGVNLRGVLNGIRAFVPRMITHGEGGHVVNTASMAGLTVGAEAALYSATKSAVVSLTESLYLQLRRTGQNVSASVLCPSWVNTRIHESARNRPVDPNMAGAPTLDKYGAVIHGWVSDQLRSGLDPHDVASNVLDAVRSDRFYILTHPDWMPLVEARMTRLLNGENPEFGRVPGQESLVQRLAAVE